MANKISPSLFDLEDLMWPGGKERKSENVEHWADEIARAYKDELKEYNKKKQVKEVSLYKNS